MDIEPIKALIELLKTADIDEIEVKQGDTAIRVSRHRTVLTTPAIQTPLATSTTPTNNSAQKDDYMRSPMVGTFYRAASPTTPSFIEIGQSVNKGDVLCIIEAMKMMNHIESDRSGVVKNILIENGEPVEFDQPIIEIDDYVQ